MIRYIILTVSLHRSRNQGVSEIRNYSYTKNKQPLFIFRFSFYIYKRKKTRNSKMFVEFASMINRILIE